MQAELQPVDVAAEKEAPAAPNLAPVRGSSMLREFGPHRDRSPTRKPAPVRRASSPGVMATGRDLSWREEGQYREFPRDGVPRRGASSPREMLTRTETLPLREILTVRERSTPRELEEIQLMRGISPIQEVSPLREASPIHRISPIREVTSFERSSTPRHVRDISPFSEGSITAESETRSRTPSDAGDVSSDDPSIEETTVQEAYVPRPPGVPKPPRPSTPEIQRQYRMRRLTLLAEQKAEAAARRYRQYYTYGVCSLSCVVAILAGITFYYIHTHQDFLNMPKRGFNPEEKLMLIPREKWDDSKNVMAKPSSYAAKRVVVIQTDTETCDTTDSCSKLINALKRMQVTPKYNFLLATDGHIYETLGWQEPSPLFTEMPTMVVGFIGDYKITPPTKVQLKQFRLLLEVSEKLNYLDASYTIIGKQLDAMPYTLFEHLSTLDHWDSELSDTNEHYRMDSFA